MRYLAIVVVSTLVLGVSGIALAVSTSSWELETKEQFAEGKFENTVLASDGTIHLGPKTKQVESGERTIWCSVEDARGNRYFGTSNSGLIMRLVDGRLDTIFDTGEIAVTCLASDRQNNIYAGTMARGKIFKVLPDGETTLLCTLPEQYIWDIVLKDDETLLVATGPEGKVYSVDAGGNFSSLFDSEESNILSIAVHPESGNIYCGTSPKGLVLEVAADGKARVVCDFPSSEVWALAIHRELLYAAVNSAPVITPDEFLGAIERASAENPPAEGSVPAPSPGSEQSEAQEEVAPSSVFAIELDGNKEEIFAIPNSLISELAIDSKGNVYVATSMQARVYRITPERTSCVLFEFKEGQALTLGISGGALSWVGTGNPGNVYLVEASTAESGAYVSKVLDAQFPATWGNISWNASGALTVQTRSGNTSEPDATWSDWSAPLVDSPSRVPSRAARYLQVRVCWAADTRAVLKSLSVFYLVRNQRPRITAVTVTEHTDENAMTSAVKKVQWQAADADGDPLVYRVWYRNIDDESWIPLTKEKPLEGAEFLWNTIAVPDGKYVVKIQVSDEKNNPADLSLTFEKVSDPFLVDNEKPTVRELTVKIASVVTCTGIAEDSFSNITRIEYSVDSGEWHFVYPEDKLFDSRREVFKFDLGELPKGTHYIAVKVIDGNENAVIVQKTFSVE